MIGIIKDEDVTVLEFNPIFATKTPKWLRIILPINNSRFGEYGIAWSKGYGTIIPNVWIMWGNTGYPSFSWAMRDFKRYLKRVLNV